ncbi:MAG: hypothetical protein BVN28_07730 [Nitrospira sp. ST-bin4]|nr:MAG: hypothetical protein BVN28_07730 [Nitrospira sp. ST-bin4]
MAAVHGVPAGGYCGRARQIQDAINGFTGGTYDPNGNLLTVTDAKNQTTMYTYDSMLASQAGVPKGCCRFTQVRRAVSS